MKSIKLKIKDLFRYLSIDNNKYEVIQNSDKKIYTLTPDKKIVPILGYVKKYTKKSSYKLENGITINCADKHLIISNDDVKRIDNAETVLCIDGEYKIISKNNLGEGEAYDISIPDPHLYVTPNGIIHHNTTVAKILAKKFSPNSYMYINASEQGNIDTVRNLISEFISVMSIDGNQKIVILDECLEENTLVSILKDGSEQKILIKDVDPDNDLVKTYNFDLSRIEYRPFFKIDKGVQEVYEVEFENGEFIVCTEDHKWYVEDPMTGEITRKKLKDIISNNISEILTV